MVERPVSEYLKQANITVRHDTNTTHTKMSHAHCGCISINTRLCINTRLPTLCCGHITTEGHLTSPMPSEHPLSSPACSHLWPCRPCPLSDCRRLAPYLCALQTVCCDVHACQVKYPPNQPWAAPLIQRGSSDLASHLASHQVGAHPVHGMAGAPVLCSTAEPERLCFVKQEGNAPAISILHAKCRSTAA